MSLPGMGGPGGPGGPGGQKKKGGKLGLKDLASKETLNGKYGILIKPFNHCYHLYQITTMFARRGLWVFSCMSLMYGLPIMIEYMGE